MRQTSWFDGWRWQDRLLSVALLALAGGVGVAWAVWADETPQPLGPSFILGTQDATSRADPRLAAAADGSFLVVWEGDDGDETGILGRLFDPMGLPTGETFQINTYTTDAQQLPSVESDAEGRFLVVYQSPSQHSTSALNKVRRGRWIGADGQPIGDDFPLAGSFGKSPEAAILDNGEFVVAWEARESTGYGPAYFIQGRRYASDGLPLGDEFDAISANTSFSYEAPDVAALDGGEFVVTWEEFTRGRGVYGHRYSPEGESQGIFVVADQGGIYIDENEVAALPQGEFVVSWRTYNITSDGFYPPTYFGVDTVKARRFDAEGLPLGDEIEVGVETNWPSVEPHISSLGRNGFVVIWDSSYTRIDPINIQSFHADGDRRGDLIQFDPGVLHEAPAVADLGDGEFVVTWAHPQYDGTRRLEGQRFSVRCQPSETELCLGDGGRFKASVHWRDFDDAVGNGRLVDGASEDSGVFWFFSPDNWELLVKVIDGCEFNGNYWVFAAAITNVEYSLTVTDTLSGVSKTYDNPLGQASDAVTDTAAFASCP